MNILKEILLYIWQLPQNLLGLIMLLFMKPYVSKEKYKGITYIVSKKMSGGISLGNYVILSNLYKDKERNKKVLNADQSGQGGGAPGGFPNSNFGDFDI